MSERFVPRDPAYAERVRGSFARQSLMATLGARLERVEPGAVTVALPRSDGILQQHGFVHGGAVAAIADVAAGYAALSLTPPGTGVLTVEIKINLLAPARAPLFRAEGRVIRPGRTLTMCQTEVFGAEDEDGRLLVAVLTGTMMSVAARSEVVD